MKPTTRSSKASLLQRSLKKQCRECTVVVARMDFAKILGKFTKVKIQYETSSPPKKQKARSSVSSPVNSRLKQNENGMVLIHRNAYSQHPVKGQLSSITKANLSKTKANLSKTKANSTKTKANSPKKLNTARSRQLKNILKENNRIKKTHSKTPGKVIKKSTKVQKEYKIVFETPKVKRKMGDERNTVSLPKILPYINDTILPSNDWSIEFYPKEEVKNDLVYNKIAAELEDLMFNNKSNCHNENVEKNDMKLDDLPSLMDIINEPMIIKDAKVGSSEGYSDVEAMLLGEDKKRKITTKVEPRSPTLLNESTFESSPISQASLPLSKNESQPLKVEVPETDSKVDYSNNNKKQRTKTVTYVVFKHTENSNCLKSVTCMKNLKYSVQINGKHVELIAAPKFVTSVQDLKILLEIVHESQDECPYLCYS